VGGDENHAYFNGVPVIRTKIMAYMTSGVFAALAGLYRTIEVNKGSPIGGDPFILTSAAAVLIGGIALSGGRGDLVAALAGAFIMLFINDLIFFAGISSFYTPMAQGFMLIFAVFLGVITYRIKLQRAVE
jgi:ribose/xylose/arabinose/galactoside ABC-type transport system permease subunit